MREDSKKLINEFLGPLNTYLQRGKKAYINYMSDGKKYAHAKILKENNEKIRALLISKCHLLPEVEQKNALDIIEHIDIWCTLWEDLNSKRIFSICDEFVFSSTRPFPHQSEEYIIKYYLEIKGSANEQK